MDINFADVATNMNVVKTLAIALGRFHQKTAISPKMIFSYSGEEQGLEIGLAFSPREPSTDEYKILFEEINNAEKLLVDEYIITNAPSFENLKQFVFKHKEDKNQIIDRHKNG